MADTPPEKSWPFICPHCERPANAIARGKAVWDGWGEGGEPENPPVEWTLVQCHRCSQPTLQARENFGGGFADDEHPATVYPTRRQLPTGVPAGLRREWEEAQTCFDAKAYAASVVMVRRTLEGTCQEQGVKVKNLSKALEELAAKGRIDQTLAEWANVLRRVGNKGAHYTGQAVPRQDAEDALAFAEALLDHLYVLRRRFDEFRARQS